MALLVPLDGEEVALDDANMLEKLPSDVMVRVNEFLKLPDRIRLASSSKSLQRLVFQDCIPLWHDIDFSTVHHMKTKLLTDYMLSKLLIRVNAKTVTRSLNLDGCTKLTGMGLHPMSGSEILERLYLQREHIADRLDEDIFVPILRTMIPFRLDHISFHMPYADSLQSAAPCLFIAFLFDLRAARLRDAREQNLSCFACHGPVADDSMQLIPSACGVPSLSCGTCRNLFCRHGSCSVALTDCLYCGDTSCDKCAKRKQCFACKDYSCEACCEVFCCAVCSKGYCRYCDQANFSVAYCVSCEKLMCTECRHGQDGLMRYCEGCDDFVCGDCREVKDCLFCESSLCTSCVTFNFLDCCGSLVCSSCFVPRQCDQCDKKYCPSETVEKCDLCKRMLCEDCAEVNQCGTCPKKCCVFCREMNVLSCCGKVQCVSCVAPKERAACSKKVCKKHADECGSCRKCLCDECGTNPCITCRRTFCNDDCAFVDNCEQCEASCCEECSVVLRCLWCGVSCCERCRRRGGCCEMCNDRPSKKAKLSR